MRYRLFLLILFSIFSQIIIAQTLEVGGFIYELDTGEPIEDALIYHDDQITYSNEHGYFSLALEVQGNTCIKVSRLGFLFEEVCTNFQHDTLIEIELELLSLDEITVKEKRIIPAFTKIQVSASNIIETPLIGGDDDIIKFLVTEPSIASGMEGFSQISVRGGGLFDNQYYVDGIPLHNTGHFLGLTSIFNSRVIQNVDVYVNDFPAEKGGRLSSFLDVNFKEGNSKHWNLEYDIGPLDGDILMEGPLDSTGRTTVLGAFRSAYIYSLVNELQKNSSDDNIYVNYLFYDLNAKISHEFNPKSRIFLSYYRGYDSQINNFLANNTSGSSYENSDRLHLLNNLLAFRWYKVLDRRKFLTYHMGLSSNGQSTDFIRKYSEEIEGEANYIERESERTTLTLGNIYNHLKIEIKHQDINFQIGIDGLLHRIQPFDRIRTSSKTGIGESIDNYREPILHGLEGAIYAEARGFRWKGVNVNTGMRLAFFHSASSLFIRPEPRVSMSYLLYDQLTINTAFSINNQFLHPLITSGNSIQPSVLWIPSQGNLVPQHSKQGSIGLSYSFEKGRMSLETYYKAMGNLSFYNEVELSNYENWNNKILTDGEGIAKGLEFKFERKLGKKSAVKLSYALSRSTRMFKELNGGEPYLFRFGRLHDLVINSVWNVSKRWTLSGTFYLNSNIRTTFPTSFFPSSIIVYDYHLYNQINNVALPLYHRMDLGAIWQKELSKKHIYGFRFGVYNAYNRTNVANGFPRVSKIEDGEELIYKTSIKGRNITGILPYLNVFVKRKLK